MNGYRESFGGYVWHSCFWVGWKQWLWVGCLSLLLVACGGQTPSSIVDTALRYQAARGTPTQPTLVGNDLLNRYTAIRKISIRSERPLNLAVADGETFQGYRVQGTYTLEVHPPGQRQYSLKGQAFELTLAQLMDTEGNVRTWALAYPTSVDSSDRPKQWTLVDFLPPAPELPTSDIGPQKGLRGSSPTSGKTSEVQDT
jgi:hypothetical protein